MTDAEVLSAEFGCGMKRCFDYGGTPRPACWGRQVLRFRLAGIVFPTHGSDRDQVNSNWPNSSLSHGMVNFEFPRWSLIR